MDASTHYFYHHLLQYHLVNLGCWPNDALFASLIMASMDDLSFGDSHPSISTHSERDEYYSQGLRRRFKIDALRTADHQQEGESADIGYEVDEAKYRRRVEARLLANDLPTTVPAGWPTKVSGPLVWGGDDFPDETEYVYQLTDADKAEIALALDHFKGQSFLQRSDCGLLVCSADFKPLLGCNRNGP